MAARGVVTPGFVRSIRTLNTVLNRAKKLRLITVNPCEFVDPPRYEAMLGRGAP